MPSLFPFGFRSDPDAEIFFRNVETNGGTVSPSTREAVLNFVIGCKSDGCWTPLKDVGLFVGTGLGAALTKLKTFNGSNFYYTNNNFVSGDYSEATGLTGDGSSKSLAAGFQCDALTIDNTHISVYNRSSTPVNGWIGVIDDLAVAHFALAPPFGDGVFYSDQYESDTGGRVNSTGAIGTPFGFLVGSKTSSSFHGVYRNGSPLASNLNVAESTLPSREFFAHGGWINGGPGAWMNYAISFVSAGDGLSAQQITDLNSRVQTLQSAMGRRVI